MGFLSEIKKLLFVKKSVAKSAADKTADYAKEKGADLMDDATDLMSNASEKISDSTAGLRDSILEKGSDLMNKSKDTLESLSDNVKDNEIVKKAGDFTESVGEKVMESGAEAIDKLKDVSEKVGEKVMDVGGDLGEKFGEASESVGAKVLDAKDKVVEKAKEVTDKLGEKLDETIEKAEAFQAEQDAKPKREFAEDDLDASGSMLEGTDDFFSKAEKYADGDHGAFSEGKITITESEGTTKKDIAKAAGFEDLDGDGNELIDDAIVE